MTDVTGRNRVQAGVPTGGQFATEAKAENPDLTVQGPQSLLGERWQYGGLTIDATGSKASPDDDFFERYGYALDAVQEAGVSGRLDYREDRWVGGDRRVFLRVTLPESGRTFPIYLNEDGSAGGPLRRLGQDPQWRERLRQHVASKVAEAAYADNLKGVLRNGRNNANVAVVKTPDFYSITTTSNGLPYTVLDTRIGSAEVSYWLTLSSMFAEVQISEDPISGQCALSMPDGSQVQLQASDCSEARSEGILT